MAATASSPQAGTSRCRQRSRERRCGSRTPLPPSPPTLRTKHPRTRRPPPARKEVPARLITGPEPSLIGQRRSAGLGQRGLLGRGVGRPEWRCLVGEIAGHDGEPSLGEVPGQEIAGRVVPLAERGLASLARRIEGECGRQRPGAGLRRGARAHDLPGQVVGLGHEHHPAGRATRHISRSTATTSATWMRTVWHVTRSK